MNKVAQKKNLSCMQVFKTFQVMLKGDFSMQEIVEKLNSDEPDIIYNNSIVSKYINTCRYCGIEIPKVHNKYFITKVPFGLTLKYSEIDLLKSLENAISSSMSKKNFDILSNLINRIIGISSKKLTKIEPNDYQKVFEQFEYAVTGKRKIKLLFKNRDILECIPIKVVEQDGKVYLKVYNKRHRMIDLSRLSGIETLYESFIPVKEDIVEVVYKLKPPLAQRYGLRSNEVKISEEKDGSIVISNQDENKEHLLSRLLRYDTYCEVLKPD